MLCGGDYLSPLVCAALTVEAPWFCLKRKSFSRDLGGGELGHSLGALGDGVLGKLTGQHETYSGLYLSGCHRVPLVVLVNKMSGRGKGGKGLGNTLKVNASLPRRN